MADSSKPVILWSEGSQSMLPILIVDDTQDDLVLAERVFRRCKLLNPIEVMKSGQECISYFEGEGRFQQRILPCVVFLDLMMPGMDGLEVLRRLRGAPQAKDSIFIMLSGIANIKALNEGYQLGAVSFLIKPINSEDVVQFISSTRGLNWAKSDEGYLLSLERGRIEGSSSTPLLHESESHTQRVVTVSA